MGIDDLHKNEALRRHLFPVCKASIFLAHAGVCPFPEPVSSAIATYSETATLGDQETVFPKQVFPETRQLAAELLGAEAEAITLIGPTSVGLSLVANGLRWRKGANVLFYRDDYPSNAVVWMQLQQRGVEPRCIVPGVPGCITLDDIRPLVDNKTQLVALSSAHFISGYRPDITAIGAWLREQGVLFCLDGIQTVGVLPTSIQYVDFLAADAHKWMLGPCGVGLFYVAPQAREQLTPTLIGWNNVICPGFLTPDTVRFRTDARRYEAGSSQLVGIVGLQAALKLLKQWGHAAIATTAQALTEALRKGLRGKGYSLFPTIGNRASSITSFRGRGQELPELHKKLQAAGIITSLRQTRDGRDWIRCSPHCYNTLTEIERVLEFL